MLLHMSRWPAEWPTNSVPKSTLVFLHGMGGTGSLWRPIAAALEEQYQVLAPDQRGHGGSRSASLGADPAQFHPLEYGKDIVETLHEHGVKRAFLIGHSMGVRTACAVAHLAPDLVQGLVLIDLGFTGPAGGGLGKGLEDFLGILPSEFSSRAEARAFLSARCPDPSMGAYLAAVAMTDPQTGRTTFPFDRGALQATLQAIKNFSVRNWALEAAAVGKPILALRGENSLVWDSKAYQLEKSLFTAYPKVQFEEVPGTGHGLPFEKRAVFIQRLLNFLSQNQSH